MESRVGDAPYSQMSIATKFTTAWQRCTGCLKLQVYFRTWATSSRLFCGKWTIQISIGDAPPQVLLLTVFCSVLQCVAVRCSVLQCVAACCSVLQCVAVCCSVLQCAAVCCSVSISHQSQGGAGHFGDVPSPVVFCAESWEFGVSPCRRQCPHSVLFVLQCVAVCYSVLLCVAVCCCVLQCVAVWCSVLQLVAVWYIMLQCDAVWLW